MAECVQGEGPGEATLATALSRYKTTSWLMVYEQPLIAITAKQKNMLWSGKWMASYPLDFAYFPFFILLLSTYRQPEPRIILI